jgi:hypothetical protein
MNWWQWTIAGGVAIACGVGMVVWINNIVYDICVALRSR